MTTLSPKEEDVKTCLQKSVGERPITPACLTWPPLLSAGIYASSPMMFQTHLQWVLKSAIPGSENLAEAGLLPYFSCSLQHMPNSGGTGKCADSRRVGSFNHQRPLLHHYLPICRLFEIPALPASMLNNSLWPPLTYPGKPGGGELAAWAKKPQNWPPFCSHRLELFPSALLPPTELKPLLSGQFVLCTRPPASPHRPAAHPGRHLNR